MAKKFKSPVNQGRFKAKSSSEKSPDQLPPVFSLRYLQNAFCISRCEQREKAHFADTLHKLSQLTWADIRQAGRHQLGYEKISRQSLKVGIPAHISEDANFIAFRFDGMKSMVGYRALETFYILWLDRDFSLYDH